MKISFFRYIFLLCSLCLAGQVIAQDEPQTNSPTTDNVLTDEIEVIRPYKPILADAVKIRRNPDLTDELPFKPALTYSIIDKKLELNSNIKQLEAQEVADEQTASLTNNYVRGAAGNFGTALGEVYINTGRDRALQTGVFFKHLSQEGNLDKQQFSNQQLGVFGRSITDSYSVSGKLIYDRESTFFYGFNPLSSATVSADKQRFGTISGQAELISNYSASSSTAYALTLDAYNFSNINEGSESSAVLGGAINQSFSNFSIGLNASADLTATKDAAYKIGNSFLRANPYIQLSGNGFLVKVGANVVQEFGANTRSNIFPAVSAEIPIVSGYAMVFAGLSGDILKTSLRDLSKENPFLNNNVAIQNTVEKMNINAGVKGNVGAEFGYKIMAYYKELDNLQMFVNNPTLVNRFDVIYDNGSSEILGLDGQLHIKASDVLSIGGRVHIFNYELATENEAWFKPSLRMVSNARLNLSKNLYLDGELLLQSETYAKTFDPVTMLEDKVKMKAFMDLSAGVGYQINNQIGVFFRANNLTATPYQKYLYYSRLGMNIFGGLNYSF